jgi:hypothetical protein
MHFSRKRWRLALIAALTTIGLSVAFTGQAFAAEPGEWGSWTPETVNHPSSLVVASQGSLSEARNTAGNLFEVWRGADNNQVWMSYNNGNAVTVGGNTATYVNPTVVPWRDGFMVFHTGVDGNIYYTPISSTGATTGSWYQVPNQTTNMAVSVTQLGVGSGQLYMVYRGANDQRIWGTWFDGSGPTNWTSTQNIGGGMSPSAPSVVYNPVSDALFVMARGTDGQNWMAAGWFNTMQWYAEGGATIDSPSIGVINNGNMMVDYVDANHTVQYRIYSPDGEAISPWLPDVTGYQTNHPVHFAAVGNALYALLTGLDNLVYYKQAYYGG